MKGYQIKAVVLDYGELRAFVIETSNCRNLGQLTDEAESIFTKGIAGEDRRPDFDGEQVVSVTIERTHEPGASPKGKYEHST